MYRDRKGGCKGEKEGTCEFLHLDVVCPDFKEKRCEKKLYTCIAGNHNRNDRFKLIAKEAKKAAKEAKADNKQPAASQKQHGNTQQDPLPADKVAVPLCQNWYYGVCLAELPGEMRCYAGAHIPDMKGRAAFDKGPEDFAPGPASKLATAGPKFTPATHPVRGRGRGKRQQ